MRLARTRARSTERQPLPSVETPMVEVRDLEHGFMSPDGVAVQVLKDLNLTVERGEFVAIVGPSGCGKTTLLNLVSGLEEVQDGTVKVGGRDPVAGDHEVGYLFARDALLPWRTVASNAELALELAQVSKAERTARAAAMLAEVGLGDFGGSYPAQLSQGMRQRVAIARTLAPTPALLLLDEPFSALDAQTKMLLQETFCSLWSRLTSTVMLITHDLAEAIALADRVVLLTARPGAIKRVFDIELERPRSILSLQADRRFHVIYEELWEELREEVVVT